MSQPRRLPDGRWMARYSAPPVNGKRRQPRVYGRTRKECELALAAALAGLSGVPGKVSPRDKYEDHLDRRLRQWELERGIKPTTLRSYREAIELYFRPGLGHLRLADLGEGHFRDLAAAMTRINRPEASQDRSELMRRLLAVRATMSDGSLHSGRPLSDARIKRVIVIGATTLADLVPNVLPFNPAAGIRIGRTRKTRPLLWTAPRIERWEATGQVPGHVMVWGREQCGAFLDGVESDRMYPLFVIAAYFGLRRSELCGLAWTDVDLAARRIHVRQAQVADQLDSTKSEDSERIITIDPATAEVLRDWRKVQLAERMRWAGVWTDTGRVFTREDGTPLRPAGVSQKFRSLIARMGLPPIRFHDLRHGAATMLPERRDAT